LKKVLEGKGTGGSRGNARSALTVDEGDSRSAPQALVREGKKLERIRGIDVFGG